MTPEQRDIQRIQREGFPITPYAGYQRGTERCWFYLHTSGVAPIRCSLQDGHPEIAGVKGRGHKYEGAPA